MTYLICTFWAYRSLDSTRLKYSGEIKREFRNISLAACYCIACQDYHYSSATACYNGSSYQALLCRNFMREFQHQSFLQDSQTSRNRHPLGHCGSITTWPIFAMMCHRVCGLLTAALSCTTLPAGPIGSREYLVFRNIKGSETGIAAQDLSRAVLCICRARSIIYVYQLSTG